MNNDKTKLRRLAKREAELFARLIHEYGHIGGSTIYPRYAEDTRFIALNKKWEDAYEYYSSF